MLASRFRYDQLEDSTHVRWAIHQRADLVDGEIDHLDGVAGEFGLERRGRCRSCEDEVTVRLEGSLELCDVEDCALGRS